MREVMDQLRGSGVNTGGPAPYTSQDGKAFAAQLDRFLSRHAPPGTSPGAKCNSGHTSDDVAFLSRFPARSGHPRRPCRAVPTPHCRLVATAIWSVLRCSQRVLGANRRRGGT
jgi:hypothetical protein